MTSAAIRQSFPTSPSHTFTRRAHAALFLGAASLVTTVVLGGSMSLFNAHPPRAVLAEQPLQTLVVTATRLTDRANTSGATQVAASECQTAVC